MPNGTRTKKKTLRSSLCDKVSFNVPTSWDVLTQVQLRVILKLLYLYGDRPDGMRVAKFWALRFFCGFDIIRHTDAGWLCLLKEDKRTFILADGLLPSLMEQVSWMDHPEEMTVRLEQVGDYRAVDVWLRQFYFGHYLELENRYQNFLVTHDDHQLQKMFRRLYGVKDDDPFIVPDYIAFSVFLWYTAIKKYFANTFTHFLRPVTDGQQPGTRQSQHQMMQAQIRLLTKGDVTKFQQVMDSDTWQALAELDALARESEEFNRKYGKKPV